MKNKKKRLDFKFLDIASPCAKSALIVSLVITTISGFISGLFYNTIQPEIPLFYSLANTSSQLTGKSRIFLLPIVSLFVGLIHFLLTKYLYSLKVRFIKVFAWATVLIQALILTILIRIIWVIT